MARADLVNILYTKKMSALDFHFESLTAPPLYSFISDYDIRYMKSITSHPKLASKPKEKSKLICEVMEYNNFKKMVAGTNRICFKSFINPNIVAKVALDDVGLKDNPAEFGNQNLLKPFITKVFEVSYEGEIGLFERVQPITSARQFLSIAPDVFDLLNKCISGKYVLDDVGSNYFLNYGIRNGFGPVLLDFPYVYELDGKKLICNKKDPNSPTGYCMGEIDYDLGFNNLICEKCGKRYLAIDLKKEEKNKNIIVKGDNGGIPMKIIIKKGDNVIKEKDLGDVIRTVDFVPHKAVVKVTVSEDGKLCRDVKEVKDDVQSTNEEPITDKTVVVRPTYKDDYRNNRNKNKRNNDQRRDKNRRDNQFKGNKRTPYKNNTNYNNQNSNKAPQNNDIPYEEDQEQIEHDVIYYPPKSEYNENTSVNDSPVIDPIYKRSQNVYDKLESRGVTQADIDIIEEEMKEPSVPVQKSNPNKLNYKTHPDIDEY